MPRVVRVGQRTFKSDSLVWVEFSSVCVCVFVASVVRQFVTIVIVADRFSFQNVPTVACVLDFLWQLVSREYQVKSAESIHACKAPGHLYWLESRDERDLHPS